MMKKDQDLKAIADYASKFLKPNEDISEFMGSLKKGSGRRRSKYHNVKCETDGIKFDSQLERDTYLQILELKDRKAILAFKLQTPFPLACSSGKIICKYIADFVVKLPDGKLMVIEAKGVETAVWKLKKKFFVAEYPAIALVVVKSRSQFPLL